ncbi:MAG TPA: ParB N-terminal domain-containing protein [Candidatus Glassbacteria bacterium]|nr:ParB N-terminal domain-containing protein [Candidatus Glassbacteria bacterium]
MKIKVADLVANPYRHMKRYPLDLEKVKRLKVSINETSFWDNILARPHPDKKGKHQIAYGHHRLIALRELRIVEVDIPTRALSDVVMVQIMANENLEWNTSPIVINQTVLTTKEFLDKELVKHNTLEEWREKAPIEITGLFDNCVNKKTGKQISAKQIWGGIKTSNVGVGRDTISKFLGDNWKEWIIQQALETIRDDKAGLVDRKAVEEMPTMEQARVFKRAVKNYNIPKADQKKIAKKITKDGIGKRDIPKTIQRIANPKKKINDDFQQAEQLIEDIKDNARKLLGNIHELKNLLKKLDVKEIKGLKVFEAKQAVEDLKKSFSELKGTKNDRRQIIQN